MAFEVQEKQGLIVYLYSIKLVKGLRNFGDVSYISKKMRYAVLYVDKDENLEDTIKKISNLKFVKHIVTSNLNELMTEIKNELPDESTFNEDLED